MQRSTTLVLAGVLLAMGMQADAALITHSSKGSFWRIRAPAAPRALFPTPGQWLQASRSGR